MNWKLRYAATTLGFNPFDYAHPLPGSTRYLMRWKLHEPFKVNGHSLSHLQTIVSDPIDDNHLVSDVYPADATGRLDLNHPLVDDPSMVESAGTIHEHVNPELAHMEAFKNFIKNTRGLLVPEEDR